MISEGIVTTPSTTDVSWEGKKSPLRMSQSPAEEALCIPHSSHRLVPATKAEDPSVSRLLDDLGDVTGTHGAAAFADSEAQTDFHGDGGDQLDGHGGVVAGHDHLDAFLEVADTSHVSGADVELGTIAILELGVAAALFLGQHVDLALELGVGLDGAGNGQDLTTLDIFLLGATQQAADVVTSLTLLQHLAEHLNTSDGGLLGVTQTDDLDGVADLDHTTLHTAGHNSTTTLDGEDVLDGHQEGLVQRTDRLGDEVVNGFHQVADALGDLAGLGNLLGLVGGGGGHQLGDLQGGTTDDGGVVAGEVVLVEEVADLGVNQLEQVGIIDHVGLVHEDDDGGDAHLAGQQDVLGGLGHHTVSGGDDQDGAIHLGSTSDHVLDVVGVSGAVHVSVVPLGGLVLDVGGVDGDTTSLFLGGVVDLGVVANVTAVDSRLHHGDGGSQSGLTVVDVADGADVAVGLIPHEGFFCHFATSFFGCEAPPDAACVTSMNSD
jgi:hypothetical protein